MPIKEKLAESQEDTLSLVLAGAEHKGDLPVLNASISKVRRLSSDPNSHAMELAQTILKDSNLSSKVLRIANSPYYARGIGKIGSVSRAVVMLGFDTIKNLCVTLKLLESFQDDHSAAVMRQLIARAFFSAGFVRDLAIQAGIKDAEETYICGLLHNLGEIATAYFAAERFDAACDYHRAHGGSWEHAQLKILGTTCTEIGQRLVSTWNFSNRIAQTMAAYNGAREGAPRSREQLGHALVSLGNDVVGKLYVEHMEDNRSLREMLKVLSDYTGLQVDRLENSLTASFHASCDLAREYGLGERLLEPIVSDSSDDFRDRLARQFAFYASSQAERGKETAASAAGVETELTRAAASSIGVGGGKPRSNDAATMPSPPQSAAPLAESLPTAAGHGAALNTAAARGDALLQLSIIQEITTMVTNGESLNRVFVKILEGLNHGVGFERAMLCLISQDRSSYGGRIAVGKDTDPLRLAIGGKIDEKTDLFSRVLAEGSDLCVTDVGDSRWRDWLGADLAVKIGTRSFMIGGVRAGQKAIGFFYADNGLSQASIGADQQRGFGQFITQARLAVRIRG